MYSDSVTSQQRAQAVEDVLADRCVTCGCTENLLTTGQCGFCRIQQIMHEYGEALGKLANKHLKEAIESVNTFGDSIAKVGQTLS